ncbi:hypothetical protein COOONC_05371 [Cooperia oncophora]
MLQEELTETTTFTNQFSTRVILIDFILRLKTNFVVWRRSSRSKSFDDIDMSFNLRDDINVDRDYFLEMMAGALTHHFGIETEASDLEGFSTLQDINSYISSRQ